ncbi:MAG TPA: oligoribonuclease [Rhodoglobus sp.]|nr:oligoribonuclease [Rhodoglobus sp.]
MSETPTLAEGDSYVVFYAGGPYDGQSESRISTDGTWETEITVLAAFEGTETQLDYVNPQARVVGDEVHVTYTWNQADSEPIQALDERNDD